MKLFNEAMMIIKKSILFERAWTCSYNGLKEAKELKRVVEKYIQECEKERVKA